MKNNIVFTQDVPGERDWLKQHFPGCEFLETEFGGKWPAEPFCQSFDAVYEIPPDSTFDLSMTDSIKYKSLYQIDENFISPRWIQSNKLLINNLNFDSVPKSRLAQVIHFPRSATVFLEDILLAKCNYVRNNIWGHYMMSGNDNRFYKMIQDCRPDIFFCYRKNWWEWFVSFYISENFGYHHYNNTVDWDSLPPFELTQEHSEYALRIISASWNAMCHFRTFYPNLNFYIFEFSDLIQQQHLTKHRKIDYDKKQLISNYDLAKNIFESKYKPQFDQLAANALSHLQTMNCKVLKNFDSLII